MAVVSYKHFMITGTLSLSSVDVRGDFTLTFSPFSSRGELICRPVDVRNFAGWYFLHPALPYTDDDVFYPNGEDDILVLLSGSVFNTI